MADIGQKVPENTGGRFHDQEVARDQIVAILKKYELVKNSFGAAIIYADGKLTEHVETTGKAYGIIDPSRI